MKMEVKLKKGGRIECPHCGKFVSVEIILKDEE